MMQLLETSSLYEDNDYIMRKIKEIFRVESVPELIPVLEKESLLSFTQQMSSSMILDWNIDQFEFSNFYKESNPVKIGFDQWILCIWCFEHEERLEISIKPLDVIKESKRKIAAISVAVTLQDEVLENIIPQIISIPVYSHNQTIIRQVSHFNPENIKSLNIKIFAKPENLITMILTNIAESPNLLLEGYIGQLSKTHLLSLLNLKYLNNKI